MHWIGPSEKDAANAALEKRCWDAADHAEDNRLVGPIFDGVNTLQRQIQNFRLTRDLLLRPLSGNCSLSL